MNLVCILLVAFHVFSSSEKNGGSAELLRDILKNAPASTKTEHWYGSLPLKPKNSKCGYYLVESEGDMQPDGISVFSGDMNNDGETEYAIVSRCGGSARTDTVLDVFKKKGSAYVSLGFDDVLSKNNLDGSDFSLHIAQPFLSTSSGKTIINFKGQSWLWEKDKFQLYKK